MIIKMIDPRNDEVNGRFVELVASVAYGRHEADLPG